MKRIHVFTSAACNYIPKVRALAESIRKWHPEWVFHLALSDRVPTGRDLSSESFDEVHPAENLGIPDFIGWAFCHSIVELSTAIKPFLLMQLLEREDCEGVVYLDPDTVVFSRLDEVVEVMSDANVALTPHQVTPETGLAAVMDNEVGSLKHGIYNLGFIAVSATEVGRSFARWWADRAYYFCRAEISHGLFTDQRWIDLVPAFFEGVAILRTSRLNVATWNLTTRELSGDAPSDVRVDGLPLGFYHFTGFDSGAHRVMMHKNALGNKTVLALVNWYAQLTARANDDPLSRVPWAYGEFADGSPIAAPMRLIYRERLDLQRVFPNPFGVEGGGYRSWWNSQGRVEYPKLFDDASVDAEMHRLKGMLTPGFRAGQVDQQLNARMISAQLVQAMTDSAHRAKLLRRTWEILRTEGYRGITRRLSSP